MQEAQCSLCILIQEMGDDILILLCFFNRKEGIFQASREAVGVIIILFITSFKRRKLRVHTHQTCHTSDILVNEPSDEIDHACVFRFCSNVQQADVLRIQVSAKSLEKPKMRGEFSAVQMFEASEDLEILSFEVFSSTFRVSHARIPQILIQQRDILLNRRRKVPIISHIAPHPLSVVIINLIEYDIDSFLQFTLRLAIQFIQSPVKLNHRIFFLLIAHKGSLVTI